MYTHFWDDYLGQFGKKETSQMVSHVTKSYFNGTLTKQSFTEDQFISAIIGVHKHERYRPYHDEFLFTLFSMGYNQHPDSEYLLLGFIEGLIDRDKLTDAHFMLSETYSLYPIHGHIKMFYLYARLFAKLGDERFIDFTTLLFESLELDEAGLHFFIELFEVVINDLVDDRVLFNGALQLLLEAEKMEELKENNILISNLAYCYDKVQDYKSSIEYYNILLDRDPLSHSIWFKVATVYAKQENLVKALEAYDYAIALEPKNSIAYLHKASLLFNFSLYTEAIESAKEYLSLEPNSIDALNILSLSYLELEEYYQSRVYSLEALNKDLFNPKTNLTLSILNIREKKFAAALYHLKRVENQFDDELSPLSLFIPIEDELLEGYRASKNGEFLLYSLVRLYNTNSFDRFYLYVEELITNNIELLEKLFLLEPSLKEDLFIESKVKLLKGKK